MSGYPAIPPVHPNNVRLIRSMDTPHLRGPWVYPQVAYCAAQELAHRTGHRTRVYRLGRGQWLVEEVGL